MRGMPSTKLNWRSWAAQPRSWPSACGVGVHYQWRAREWIGLTFLACHLIQERANRRGKKSCHLFFPFLFFPHCNCASYRP